MEVLDILLKRPAIILPTIVTMMVFLMIESLKCMRVKEDLDLDLLRKATLNIEIVEFITVMMMVEVDIGLKRPSTLPPAILEFFIEVIK